MRKLLGHEVVNGRAAGAKRELPGDPVRRGAPPWGAATHLKDARAQLTQDAAKSPALGIRGGPGGVSPALRGRAEPERASLHPLTHQTLHGREFFRRGLGALRGCLTHDIAPYPRVADQGPYVDAAPLAQGLQIFGNRLPGKVDPLMD